MKNTISRNALQETIARIEGVYAPNNNSGLQKKL